MSSKNVSSSSQFLESDFDGVDAYKEYKWYMLKTKIGKEEDAIKNFLSFAELHGCQDCIKETFVPYIVSDDGKSKRNLYPGHILAKMKINKDVWQSILGAPSLGGFANFSKPNRLPRPLSDEDYEDMLNSISKLHQKIKKVGLIKEGTEVQILTGFFSGMKGVVKSCNDSEKTATLVIDIFDKEHVVENVSYKELSIIK